ncbi:MAG: hypothetical protein Q9183_006679 [Haloplaca sp. 2 TL-2023]
MSGTKRKGHVASGLQNGNAKKPKQEANIVQGRENARQDFETEEDSDPIVESDTPEYSGEDDGVSWPSDDDDTGGQGNDGYSDGVEAEIPAKISHKNTKPEDYVIHDVVELVMLMQPSVIEGKPCQTKSIGPGTEGFEAQCRLDSSEQEALGTTA